MNCVEEQELCKTLKCITDRQTWFLTPASHQTQMCVGFKSTIHSLLRVGDRQVMMG